MTKIINENYHLIIIIIIINSGMGLIFNCQERETCRTVSVFEVSTKTRPLSEARNKNETFVGST